ncbi:hypothetical protein NEAUS05_2044 [Nematocida ausubeli]|nr:hypothetical protein NEAUS05_2044 [Nematocida ausubeli]
MKTTKITGALLFLIGFMYISASLNRAPALDIADSDDSTPTHALPEMESDSSESNIECKGRLRDKGKFFQFEKKTQSSTKISNEEGRSASSTYFFDRALEENSYILEMMKIDRVVNKRLDEMKKSRKDFKETDKSPAQESDDSQTRVVKRHKIRKEEKCEEQSSVYRVTNKIVTDSVSVLEQDSSIGAAKDEEERSSPEKETTIEPAIEKKEVLQEVSQSETEYEEDLDTSNEDSESDSKEEEFQEKGIDVEGLEPIPPRRPAQTKEGKVASVIPDERKSCFKMFEKYKSNLPYAIFGVIHKDLFTLKVTEEETNNIKKDILSEAMYLNMDKGLEISDDITAENIHIDSSYNLNLKEILLCGNHNAYTDVLKKIYGNLLNKICRILDAMGLSENVSDIVQSVLSDNLSMNLMINTEVLEYMCHYSIKDTKEYSLYYKYLPKVNIFSTKLNKLKYKECCAIATEYINAMNTGEMYIESRKSKKLSQIKVDPWDVLLNSINILERIIKSFKDQESGTGEMGLFSIIHYYIRYATVVGFKKKDQNVKVFKNFLRLAVTIMHCNSPTLKSIYYRELSKLLSIINLDVVPLSSLNSAVEGTAPSSPVGKNLVWSASMLGRDEISLDGITYEELKKKKDTIQVVISGLMTNFIIQFTREMYTVYMPDLCNLTVNSLKDYRDQISRFMPICGEPLRMKMELLTSYASKISKSCWDTEMTKIFNGLAREKNVNVSQNTFYQSELEYCLFMAAYYKGHHRSLQKCFKRTINELAVHLQNVYILSFCMNFNLPSISKDIADLSAPDVSHPQNTLAASISMQGDNALECSAQKDAPQTDNSECSNTEELTSSKADQESATESEVSLQETQPNSTLENISNMKAKKTKKDVINTIVINNYLTAFCLHLATCPECHKGISLLSTNKNSIDYKVAERIGNISYSYLSTNNIATMYSSNLKLSKSKYSRNATQKVLQRINIKCPAKMSKKKKN